MPTCKRCGQTYTKIVASTAGYCKGSCKTADEREKKKQSKKK